MGRVMVTYKVKPECVSDNEELVRAVYAELNALGDPGVHYATFKLQDGVTFVHIASFDGPDKQALLTGSAAFKAFQADLKARCDEPPNPQPLEEIGSVNFV